MGGGGGVKCTALNKTITQLNVDRGSWYRSTDEGHNKRSESPAVTPPGMRVNIKCINSTKGTSSKKETWGFTSTEILRFIMDGEVGGGGVGIVFISNT